MKKGLILEGGAMRGIFSAGVMDVMMENGIEFDGIVGVSAGAAFGVNYKSKQIGRTIRYNMKYCADKRYCGIGSLIKTGNLFSTDFCYGEVPLILKHIKKILLSFMWFVQILKQENPYTINIQVPRRAVLIG